MVADAVVELENVDHGGQFGVVAPGGFDFGAGNYGGCDVWVSAPEGEHGGQREGFDAGLGAELVGDTHPQQCCGQGPAVGDFVEQLLVEGVVDDESAGELGKAATGVASAVDQLVRKSARTAMRLYDMMCFLRSVR